MAALTADPLSNLVARWVLGSPLWAVSLVYGCSPDRKRCLGGLPKAIHKGRRSRPRQLSPLSVLPPTQLELLDALSEGLPPQKDCSLSH